MERFRHYPVHRVAFAIQSDLLANNLRIAAEAPLPKLVAQHRDVTVPRSIVAGFKRPSAERGHAQHGEDVRAYFHA